MDIDLGAILSGAFGGGVLGSVVSLWISRTRLQFDREQWVEEVNEPLRSFERESLVKVIGALAEAETVLTGGQDRYDGRVNLYDLDNSAGTAARSGDSRG